MKVILPNKNKKNVIILSVLAFIFLASGIYLLWRVNQEKELSPGLSEAGGGAGACCIPSVGCVSGWKCNTDKICNTSEKAYVGGLGPDCGTNSNNQKVNCRKSFVCSKPSTNECRPAPGANLGTCERETEGPPSEGTCQNVKCEWPKVVMSHKNCACELCGGANSSICNGNPPKCTPPDCPSGYVSCGVSGDSMGSGCTRMDTKYCWEYHDDCNNPTVVYRYCKPKPQPAVCDGGDWDTNGKPSGVYPYCSDITYSFVAKDADGVDRGTIVVKLNSDTRVNASKTTVKTGDKEVRVTETLSTATNCLEPGDYKISASWKDVKGAGGVGTACALTTSFTIAEEVKNPDWNITKIPVESCIDDNTENPKAKLEYVITIKNTGEGSGEIVSITDTLDSKVLAEYVEGISSNGEFTGGKITWALTETDKQFAPGQSKTYTYSLLIPKEAFGTYNNTVEAVPSEGNSLIANSSVTADCVIQGPPEEPVVPPEEPLPDTGIFDDGQNSLILGFALLILGFTWRIIGSNALLLINNAIDLKKKVSKERELKISRKRKKNFERKVVKD